mmetsp:Transcript_21301/g.53348  ORF Transcript_21301/g.53348 Transcript_21301/m.53348 type:complete len:85 (+) Transcript_21301:448-702(+)
MKRELRICLIFVDILVLRTCTAKGQRRGAQNIDCNRSLGESPSLAAPIFRFAACPSATQSGLHLVLGLDENGSPTLAQLVPECV